MWTQPLRILLLVQAGLIALHHGPASLQADERVPRTVAELWKDFDPRNEPLETKVVRAWKKDKVVFQYVTFHIGTFKGRKSRMAAFLAFPEGGKNLPGLLHLHGGGQRAFQHEVDYYARRGYACLSINWGGREMEAAKPGDPNTDWGAVDPTQQNVPGYLNLQPGEKYLDSFPSPRNNNWYLLTLAARRGLTFLERQPQVDADRLGVYGHSMGGNLTVYVAGSDDRVKVASPSVGGQGFRTVPWKLLPKQRKREPNGDVGLYRSTLGFQSYAPRIAAPLLWLGSTNDFHGVMDDTYRTGELIPHQNVRYVFTPHMNHRFTPEFAVTRPLWIDQYLQGGLRLPPTPTSQLLLTTEDKIPALVVSPHVSSPKNKLPIDRVQIMYSVDPDPQARFWRTAAATQDGPHWTAKLPIMSIEQPLFAFANVYYRLPKPQPAKFAPPTSTIALSSMLHTATRAELQQASMEATDKPSRLVEDFTHGWQDWYRLSADNPHHWQYWTRKLCDPKWRGASGWSLEIDVQSEQPNELIVAITTNFFRPYQGRSADYVAVVPLTGGKQDPIRLAPQDFKAVNGNAPLKSWAHVDLLGLRAYYGSRDKPQFGSTRWVGKPPRLSRIRWVTPQSK